MLSIAIKHKPNFVCIVPENRKEITTEGGLNLYQNKNKLIKILSKLNQRKIRTTLFINPNLTDIILSKKLGTKCVELHTGRLANKIKKKKNYLSELNKIKKRFTAWKKRTGDNSLDDVSFESAAKTFKNMITKEHFDDFLTLPLYEKI